MGVVNKAPPWDTNKTRENDRLKMLKTKLLHPEILGALGRMGHGSRLLIADGNYPVSTGVAAGAFRVFLNLTPGVVKVTDVLAAIVSAIPIEGAIVMCPPEGTPQEIHAEFRELLPGGIELAAKRRMEFYEEAKSPDMALAIATADQRRFANIILSIGVVKTEKEDRT